MNPIRFGPGQQFKFGYNDQSFDNYVSVLVDAGCLEILKGLLQGGFDGGIKAEQMFRNSVTDILKERGVQMGFRGPAVLIQLYGDVKDLAQGYYAKGFITSPADFAGFQSGFSVAHPLSRFDDVGNSNAWWIGQTYLLHLNDDYCKHIIFGNPTHKGFEQLMQMRAPNKLTTAKITEVTIYNSIFQQILPEAPRIIAPGPPRPVGNVPRNSAGQRIDPPIVSSQLDRKLLQDKKQERLCNEYHLRGPHYCPYGGGCKFVHGTINEPVRRVLQDLAKYTHCKYGTACAYLDCYAGHRCPYECCQGTCEFPREMHFIDRMVVNQEQGSSMTQAMAIETARKMYEHNVGGLGRPGRTTPKSSSSSTEWHTDTGALPF